MFKRFFLSICLLGASLSPCVAQSTATQTTPGSISTTGCPSGSSSCYVPYSSANPVPVQVVPAPSGTGGGSVNGQSSVTGTTSTQLIAAVTSKKIYLQGWACSNSGATAVTVTFQDGSGGSAISGIIEVPAGGGNNMAASGNSWGNTSSGNALYFQASAGTTTLTCGAVGYAQ